MASIIRIKRSEVSGNPAVLGQGELAYSGLPDNGINGGDRLYIGMGTETTGNAVNHVVIGGKYFTDKLDHTPGTLTASSAIIVDADSKVDQLNVDNLRLDGNAITSTNTNGNISITPNGSGSISLDGQLWPQAAGSAGQFLTTSGAGQLSWTNVPSGSFDITGNTGTDTFSTGSTLTLIGAAPISTTVTDDTVTFRIADATTTTKGAASFATANFTVTSGEVATKQITIGATTVNNGGTISSISGLSSVSATTFTGDLVGNASTASSAAKLTTARNVSLSGDLSGSVSFDGSADVSLSATISNKTVTIGTSTVSLGGTQTSILGLTEFAVDNINVNGNTIAATNSDGNVVLAPNGSGTVDVSGKRITSLADPTQASDAATKQYVDAVAEGLHVQAGVDAATTAPLATITGGSVTYDNGVNGVGATLTLGTPLTVLDGYTLVAGDRILVKDEVTMAHNGIYTYTNSTLLTRATDYDSDAEISGGDFVFVVNGTQYNSTGWVQVDPVQVVGTDKIEWQQFSGAGTYLPGDGLSLLGGVFNVNLSETGGLQFSGSNSIELKSTVAGNGLTYLDGVVAVGGTADRIAVSADAIDIASTYAGQTSITTLGTVATGTWNATTIATTKGGTGLTSYATGDLIYASSANTLSTLATSTEGKVLQLDASGLPIWGDIDGGIY